jgi:4-hydroxy-3-methylbut-2-enyl diphosphate reductase
VKGIRVFIPVSQTDIKKDEMSVALGRKVPVVVTEVNTEKRRAIGSMSVASQIIQKKLWSEIQVGAKYRGVVKSLTSYGAFVDIGGIVGMVHVSELSWAKIKQPSDVVNVGDELDVYVISTNPEKGTISLGHKSLKQDP